MNNLIGMEESRYEAANKYSIWRLTRGGGPGRFKIRTIMMKE